MTAAAVAIGGGLGAVARYLLDGAAARRQRGLVPVGTLMVNVIGSGLAGAIAGAVAAGDRSGSVLPLASVGFLGAFTTFSTFTYETLGLIQSGAWRGALRNVAATFILSIAAAAAGYLIAS